jgi:protocatechuate 3,4-dioxygenase beta subunit
MTTRKTMRKTSLAALLIFLLAAVASAQNAGDAQKCIIEGTVADATTQQPLKGATVTARGLLVGTGANSSVANSTNTDASGHFVFSGLAAGRYLLWASHDGYPNQRRIPGHQSSPLLIAPGQHIADFAISLQPGGVIAGHIADGDGKPISGVSLEAISSSYRSGLLELHQVANVQTNAAGEYRIVGLNPGKYYLRAKYAHHPATKTAPDKAYVPLYYPSTADQSTATALTVDAGQELAGIDMTYVAIHTAHVAGHVTDARTSRPSTGVEVALVSSRGSVIFSHTQTSAGPNGAFDFLGIPPGSYVLTAQLSNDTGRTIAGRTSVEVGDDNLSNVEVVIGPGLDITGHVRMEGKTGADLSQISVNLEPLGGSANASDSYDATMKPDGTFAFHDVAEGSYRLDVSPIPPGFYLSAGGASEVLESGLTVTRSHPIPSVELLLSPGTAQIDGTVSNDDRPFSGATVVLIPDVNRRGQPRYYKVSTTSQSGRFALRGIAPGDYTIFAWEEIDRDAYTDPDILRLYEDRGKEVSVAAGDHQSVQLELIPATDE